MKRITILQALVFFMPLLVAAQSINIKCEQAIQSFVNQNKFSGTVLVASKGEIILHKAYGFRDIAEKSPNTINSIYLIASLTKQFTATIVLKLEEEGRLSVNDKLSRYYPNYPNGDKITVHHLLSHSAGIYNYTDNKLFMSGDQSKPVTLDSMINLFIDKPLGFEPGTRFSYSNSGYTLLGYIIEKITGQSFEQVLTNMIIKPLRLTHTGYDFHSLTDSNKTSGYLQHQPDNFQVANQVHSSILYTTGALYSTTGDLFKWHQSLMNNKILSPQSTNALYQSYAGPYGYGWQVDSLFGRKRVSHSGSIPGFKSLISRIPEDDICIILLSNSSTSQVGPLNIILLSILYGKPYQLPVERKAVPISVDQLKKYEGLYKFNEQLSINFTIDNNRFFAQPSNQTRFEIFAETENRFFVKEFDAQFEFSADNSGESVNTVKLTRNNQSIIGKRFK